MPNFDGGHYFLTVLAPISNEIIPESGSPGKSCVQLVRETLACLPTARQTRASEAGTLNSPFARNRRTHFARFVVINDVIYNGREPVDTLIGTIKNTNLGIPQPVDRLNAPYLLFAADIDAASGDAAELRGYLAALWADMEAELRAIFQHCIGFVSVNDADDFANYVLRCQVETTMPFNDYWVGAPPLQDKKTELLVPAAVVAVACAAVAGIVAQLALSWWFLTAVVTAVVLVVVGIYWVYRRALVLGNQPFPAAPDSDLPSVLKALYLQQQMTRFAIDQQAKDAASLHRAFGEFLARNQPDDLDHATQTPGVIRS